MQKKHKIFYALSLLPGPSGLAFFCKKSTKFKMIFILRLCKSFVPREILSWFQKLFKQKTKPFRSFYTDNLIFPVIFLFFHTTYLFFRKENCDNLFAPLASSIAVAAIWTKLFSFQFFYNYHYRYDHARHCGKRQENFPNRENFTGNRNMVGQHSDNICYHKFDNHSNYSPLFTNLFP